MSTTYTIKQKRCKIQENNNLEKASARIIKIRKTIKNKSSRIDELTNKCFKNGKEELIKNLPN